MPHARDPARPGGRRRRAAARRGRARGRLRRLAGRYGHAAREVLAVAAERGELAQPIVAGGPPDLLAEAVHAARREQARPWATRCCAARASGLLAARDVADPEGRRRSAWRAAMAERWAGTASAAQAEARAFLDEANAEGIVTGP